MIRRTDEVMPLFAVPLGEAAAAGADLWRLATAACFNKHCPVHGSGLPHSPVILLFAMTPRE